MARLQGVDLPREKRLEVALTYIFGIGRTRAAETLAATGISGDIHVKDLTDEQLVVLRDHIDANYEVEGDLRRTVAADIRRKIEIGTYQGRRHRSGLPVRGQRTRTNARTRKGKKRAVAGKKKALALWVSPETRTCQGEQKTYGYLGRRAPRNQGAAQGRRMWLPDRPTSGTFNNTIITITDTTGAVIAWASSGTVGFKARVSRPRSPRRWPRRPPGAEAMEHGMKRVDVFVKGPGSGRETAIRSLGAIGLEVGAISDVTPMPPATAAVRQGVVASNPSRVIRKD